MLGRAAMTLMLLGVVVGCGGALEADRAADPSTSSTSTSTTAPSTTTDPPTTTTIAPPTATAPERIPPPEVVRGLRVSEIVAGDRERFDALLELADASVVNTLVFDTKTEAGHVLYESDVALANEIGAVRDVYDPTELLAAAREHDLYTITRIVTFEDDRWSNARPATSLEGTWMNAADRTNWSYPIDLAVESCSLGFDEIQFDYVRFPDGQAARRSDVPAAMDERTAVIAEFLETARASLAEEGCRTSAAVFGIITASATDEGIGQTVEALSGNVDALSPMLYPSHYGPGWIGFDDPNEHPGPVIAHALDSAAPDLAVGTRMQPWIQAFYYNGEQIRAQITEAEQREAGWMLWNYSGNYRSDWLPTS
ncbi:MAG: putative glycoside hydrolase [Acidimicrobiia bacterium]|nr:putative glycoside hydrolase [Acidimicrobiia bacterium]